MGRIPLARLRHLDGRNPVSTVASMIQRTLTDRSYRILNGPVHEVIRGDPELQDRYLAFVSCAGGGGYQATSRCLWASYPLLSPGGFAFVEDYAVAEVTRAVHEFLGSVGVPKSALVVIDDLDDLLVFQNCTRCLPDATNFGLEQMFNVT